MKKRNRRKAMLILISLLSILAIGLGGMLAYLTDRDIEVNVFTLGNVDIELQEDFVQNSMLKPNVKIPKVVEVKNIGKSDAWVWVEIAIPTALDGGQDASQNIVHFNYPKDAVGTGDDQWSWLKDENGYIIKTATSQDFDKNATDNLTYNVYTIMYNSPLTPGATTVNPAMNQVYLDAHVDIDPDGDWHWVEKGVVKDLNWNTKTQGNPVIHVTAYGIQKEGFDTQQAAYDAFWQQWTGTN